MKNNPPQRYQIVRELSARERASTAIATDSITGKLVILKKFQIEPGGSPEDLKAYKREIQVFKNLNHPHIPKYLNAFKTADYICLVREFIDGTALSDLDYSAIDDLKKIALEVLEILIYLQKFAPPVVHGNLKPSNIFIDRQGSLYLTDLGLGQLDREAGSEMAPPEKILGLMRRERLDNINLPKTIDLYGLGLVLISLLARLKLSEMNELFNEQSRLVFRPRLSHLNPEFLDWLEMMVQPYPKERYPSAIAARAILKPLSIEPIPEIPLKHPGLTFKVNQIGAKMTKSLWIRGRLPATVTDGVWEVAPHPDDPPHPPMSHPWIAFEPQRFEPQKREYRVTLDTSRLIPGQFYERQLVLHKTTSPQMKWLIPLQVKTLVKQSSSRAPLGTLLASVWPGPSQVESESLYNSSQEEIAHALTRFGQASWTDADFEQLMKKLGEAGYGWLTPEGVRQQLEAMNQARRQQR